MPTAKHDDVNPTHDVTFTDKQKGKFGFAWEDGPSSMIEQSQTATTILNRGGGEKWGDYDPTLAHIEQRVFNGGRGSKDFSADRTRIWDDHNAFTFLRERVVPAPQWHIGTGILTAHQNLPGDVSWQPLTSAQRYIASSFVVGSSNLSADNVCIWLKRIGSPGTVTCEIWSDSSGPSAIVTSATDTYAPTALDEESLFYNFDLSAAADLTATNTYWVVVYGASTDNAANHWEVGTDSTGSSSEYSTAGSSWTTASFDMYYRVADTYVDRELLPFELYGALFVVEKRADGAASAMYMNGEIGVATGGTATTLTDSNEGEDGSWANDQWNGWSIKIVSGTAKGEAGTITDTTSAGVLTISGFNITPAVGDVYVIYDGDAWQTFASGTTGLGAVKDVAVMNNIAYFAQGSGDNMRRITYVSASHGFSYADDSTNKADVLHTHDDRAEGPQLWRGENDTVDASRANAVAWGTNLSFGTAKLVGNTNYDIINIIDYDQKIFVFKEDGIYVIGGKKVSKLNVGLDFLKTPNNGQAATAHKMFLFFSWGRFSVQRYYGSDLSSVGYDVGFGLPSNRTGSCTSLHSLPFGLVACNNAGSSRYSSLLIRDDEMQGWHEVFRAPNTGWRLQNVHWQDNPESRPRMWFDCNGEMFYQKWAKDTLSPLEDASFLYMHEGSFQTADMDMGAARLPKIFKHISVISDGLVDGQSIDVDYQTDNDIGGDDWQRANDVLVSPSQDIELNEDDVKKIRMRFRLQTDDADDPPVMVASVLSGFARTPHKRQWTFRFKTSSYQVDGIGTPDHNPDDLVQYLYDVVNGTKLLYMESKFESMDGVWVVLEPPIIRRDSVDPATAAWEGTFELTAREA
jgi:hypothetical protein